MLDLEVLWTVAEAAEHARVQPATIRKWIEREHLRVESRDDRGRPRLRPLDVARAEHATRQRARRVIPAAA